MCYEMKNKLELYTNVTFMNTTKVQPCTKLKTKICPL